MEQAEGRLQGTRTLAMESDPRKAFQEKVREVHEVGLLRGILLRDCTRKGDKQVGCAP